MIISFFFLLFVFSLLSIPFVCDTYVLVFSSPPSLRPLHAFLSLSAVFLDRISVLW